MLNFLFPIAKAVADADIASSTSALTTSVKENVFEVVSTNLPTIGVIFALFLGIAIIVKLTRRMAK